MNLNTMKEVSNEIALEVQSVQKGGKHTSEETVF